MILFEGQFREKEIDILFAIHPSTKVIENLTYSKLFNGKPYISDASSNDTEPENLIESLTLTNTLIGIQYKKNFQIVNENTAKVNIVI